MISWIVFIHQLPQNTCKFSLIKVWLNQFSSLQAPQHWIISVWVSSGIWRNSSLKVLLTIGWPQGNNFPTQLSDHAPAPPTPQCLVLFSSIYDSLRASLLAQTVKNQLAMWEARVLSLGREDPLEKAMAINSSTLAWTIPWTEEPGKLQSLGLQRVRHDQSTSFSFPFLFKGQGLLKSERHRAVAWSNCFSNSWKALCILKSVQKVHRFILSTFPLKV